MAGNARRDSDKRSNRSLTEEVRSLRSKVAKLERLNARHEDFSQVYRALVEHSAEGLAIIQDGRVVFANTMMVRITGYSVAELTAMSADQVQAFVHPEDREEVWRRHDDRLAGEPLDGPFQFRGLNKNGEVRWYEVRASRIMHQGRAAVQAAYSDITERVKAEQTLRESERKYHGLFERSPVGIGLARLDGSPVAANKAIEEILGYTEEELKRLNLSSLYENPEDRVAFLSRMERDGCVVSFPTRLRRKDGRCADVLISSSEVQNGGETLLQTTCVDVTEVKQLKKNLQATEERYRLLLENQNDLVVKLGLEGRLLYVSPTYCETFGKSSTELIGKKFMPLVHEDDRARVTASLESLQRPPHTSYHEERALTAKGWRWFGWSSRGILDGDGDLEAVVSVGRDITERKQAEERLARKQRETEALLTATRAIPEKKTFEEAARGIFEAAKAFLGADSGYVALLSEDGQENEVLFLDAGGRACTVDPELPMPIRGLRAKAYETREVVWENDFWSSAYARFMPEGHVALDNVLFAPILLGGKTVGAIGLANKPGGFTEDDARIAKMFGEVAGVGLRFARDQEALQESEVRFKTLIEDAPVSVLVLQGGKYVYANPAGAQRLGYEHPSEIVGKDPLSTIDPRYHDAIRKRMQQLHDGQRNRPMELEVVGKGGTRRWMESTSLPITLEGQAATLIVGVDITERKQAELTLRESERSLHSTVDGLAGSVALLDEQGRILLVNKAWRDFAQSNGLDPDTVSEGVNYLEVCDAATGESSEGAAEFAKGLRDVLSGARSSFAVDYACHSPDERRWFSACVTPFVGEGPRRVVVVHDNITSLVETQLELRRKEQYYRDLIHSLHEDVLVIDREYRITDINDTALRTLGLQCEGVIGRHCYEVLHGWDTPCDAHGKMCGLQRTFETGLPCSSTHEYITDDGDCALSDIRTSPVKDEDGNITHVIEAMRDITDLFQAQKAITESEERFRGLFEGLRDGVFVHRILPNGQPGPFEQVNQAACQILGYSRDELRAMSPLELDDPDTRDEYIPKVMRQLREVGHAVFEAAQVAKNGRKIPVEVNSRVVELDGESVVISVVRDLTERRAAEVALRESENQLRRAQQVAHIGSWSLDLRTSKLVWSDETYRIFGLPIGKPLTEEHFLHCIHPDDYQFAREAWAAALAGAPYDIEHRIIRDGVVKWVREIAVLESDDEGQPIRGIGTVQNITDRKQAEERLRILMANLPGMAYRCANEPDWPMDFVSEGCRVLTGYDPEEITSGRVSFGQIIHPEDQQRVWATIQEAIAGENTFELEYRIRAKDGQERFVWERGLAVVEGGGAGLHLEGFISDVTTRVQVERERELQAMVLDQIQDRVTVTDLGGRITYVNQAEVESLGYRREQLIGRHVATYGENPARGATQQEIVEKTKRDGCWRGEVVNYATDGREVILDCRTRAVHDRDGKVVALCGVGTDVTNQKRIEAKIRESEAKFRALFEQAPDSVVLTDAETGQMVEFNDRTHESLDYARDEFSKLRIVDIEAKESPEETAAHIAKVKRCGQDTFETQHRTKDGRILDVLVSTRTISLHERDYFLSIWTDITDRKRAEQALLRSQELFSKAFHSGPLLMTISCIEDGTYLEVNDNFVETTGYSRAEAVGTTSVDLAFISKEDRESLRQAMVAEGRVSGLELTLRKKSGETLECLYFGELITVEGKQRLLSIAEDITERKQVERALKESESKFRQFFESLPDHAYIVSPDGLILEANEAAVDGLGYAVEELVDTSVGEIYAPESRERAAGLLDQWRRGGSLQNEEMTVLTKAGERRTVLLTAGAVRDIDGRVLHSTSIHTDITERKRAEQALERQRAELQAIYDHSPVMMCVLDKGRHVLYVNHAFTEFTGMSESDLKGGRACGIFGCANALTDPRGCGFGEDCDPCKLRRALEETLKTGRGHHGIEYHATLELPAGRRDVTLLGSTALVQGDDEANLLLCLQDISARVAVERHLRRTTELLTAIRDAQALHIRGGEAKDVYAALLKTLVTITDSEYGFLDEVCEDETGLYKRSLALSNISWDEESRQLYHRLVENRLEFRNLQNLAGEPAVTGELTISNNPPSDRRSGGIPHGHPALKAFMGIPLRFGDEVVGVAGMANRPGGYDEAMAAFLEPFVLTCAGLIEAGRRSERERRYVEALTESEGTARALLNTPGLCVLMVDADGKILALNTTLADIFGGAVETLVGSSVWEYFPAAAAKLKQDVLNHVIRSKQPYRHEEVNGDHWYDTFVHPIVDAQGQVGRVVVVAADITDRKRMEKQARQKQEELLHVSRLTTLGEMASSLAHELNQPLSAIVNLGAACTRFASADQPNTQRIALNLERITTQAERAKEIMQRIRGFAQRQQPRLTSVDLNCLVREVVEFLSSDFRQQGVSVQLELSDPLPCVRGDLIQLEQVLVNLLRNALEAMEKTEPKERSLVVGTRAATEGMVQVEVVDTGIGLPEEHAERIFEAFFTSKPDGLGMGLSISRTILEIHNGTLKARRNPERGSTFSVSLPVLPTEEQERDR